MAADPYITTYSQTYSELGLRQSKMWPPNTLCMTIAGANTAKVAILKIKACFPDSVIGFIPDKSKADLHFVMYSLGLMKEQFLAVSRGATQDNLGLNKLLSFPLSVPDVHLQRRIAGILSAYDELIENNKRRIALLEKMAEEIHREWFVRLRFPGYQKVKRTKGVPNGWEVAELRTVSIEAGRSTKPGIHLAERFYLPLDLLNTRQMIPVGHLSHTEAQSSLVTFEKGDILFGAMRPYLHKVAIAPFAGITRTTCFVIRPKMLQAWSWLFLTLFQQSSVDLATMICNGSDRPYAVWNKGMERMKLLRPDDALLAKFEETVRPILDSIAGMYFVQLKLTSCRDLLLPRLISGKLSVEKLDIEFPPSMAEELKAEPNTTAYA
jgi:type I restriction enzyme, S subunit